MNTNYIKAKKDMVTTKDPYGYWGVDKKGGAQQIPCDPDEGISLMKGYLEQTNGKFIRLLRPETIPSVSEGLSPSKL